MATPPGPIRKRPTRATKPVAETGASGTRPKKPAQSKEFSDYAGALAYLANRPNVEQSRPSQVDVAKIFNLERMRALVAALGHPERNLRCVHVAGSKGKGSVCEMTASCLSACGYAVGLYTSPHLVSVHERIRINQTQIDERAFTSGMRTVAAAAAGLARRLGELTYFELMTALAFVHFAEQAVDLAIIETGMGGRLDATNVVTPELSVITAIQLEHTEILGNTLEAIAAEKAGIIKPGVPVLTGPQTPGVMAVLTEAASASGSPLLRLSHDFDFSYRFESSTELGPHAKVCLTSLRSCFEHLPVPLKGDHQAVNCGLALAVIDTLRGKGLDAPERAVAEGLAKTPSNGRLELIHKEPRIFVDGAHNPDSIAALVRAIGAQVRYDSMVVIFGCAADKDVPALLANIALGADKVIFTKAEGSARAMESRDLLRRFAEVHGKMAQTAPTLKEALNMANSAVGRDDLILVTGSFALAGEAKRLLQERARRRAAAGPTPIREVKPSGIARKKVRRKP